MRERILRNDSPRRFNSKIARFAALFAVIAMAAAWSVSLRHARADEPRVFAIRGARIVTVSGAPIDNGTVVVANGLIAAVGANATIPADAEVIDGAGMTVYPGLIDAGTDTGLESAAAPAATAGRGGGGGGRGGNTNAPQSRGAEDRPATTPWVSAGDELNAEDRRMENWRDAGFTTALVLPQSGIFPGQGSLVDFSGAERAGDLVVKNNAALPINFNGGRGLYQGFPSSLMGDLAYVHQVFIDAQWYADAQKIYSAHPQGLERPAYDRTNVVIGHALASKELVLVPGQDDIQIVRALKMAPQWGINWALFGAQQGYDEASAIAAAKIPVVVEMNWPVRDRNMDADAAEHESLRTLRFRDRAPGTPAALSKAGVKFAFASSGISSAGDLLKNVNKAIAAGLSPEAALKALTIDAAEIFGVSDRLGTIEPGKIANLVVTNGDLFKEGTQIKWVFVDGKRFEVRTPPPPPPGAGRGGNSGAGGGENAAAGHWNIVTDTGQGTEEAELDIEVAADGSVSGTISSHMGTSSISGGHVSGNSVTFNFSMDVGDGPTQLSVQGTVDGQRISGTINVSGMSLPFTGTKPRTVESGSSSAEVVR